MVRRISINYVVLFLYGLKSNINDVVCPGVNVILRYLENTHGNVCNDEISCLADTKMEEGWDYITLEMKMSGHI